MFMKKNMEKRGISPVIATVLLISISLILATIIFLWARGFVTEKTQKFETAIEFACDDIVFSAEVDTGSNEVFINNKGNVPLYGIEIRERSLGSVKNVGVFEGGTITVGDGAKIPFADLGGFSPVTNSNVIVVPIILGESGDSKKSHVCEEEFGELVTVI
jgi:hypothetical protein